MDGRVIRQSSKSEKYADAKKVKDKLLGQRACGDLAGLAEDGSDPIMSDVLDVKHQQVEGIRRLSEQLIETLQNAGSHIRKLVESLLDRAVRGP